jgi:hypothetical protein
VGRFFILGVDFSWDGKNMNKGRAGCPSHKIFNNGLNAMLGNEILWGKVGEFFILVLSFFGEWEI